MARGKAWTIQEQQYASRAYILSTTNSVVGCDQTPDNFAKSIHLNLKRIQPICVEPGLFSERTAKNIWAMLRDTIFPDIQKYIGTLNLVNNSHPTGGLSLKEYHCMAIAIHLNLTKKVDSAIINREVLIRLSAG